MTLVPPNQGTEMFGSRFLEKQADFVKAIYLYNGKNTMATFCILLMCNDLWVQACEIALQIMCSIG